MTDWIPAFVGGVLGSAHCIGMCGGFAAAIGATHQPFRPTLVRQLVYSAGRVFTYSFLGACGGTAGMYLSQFKTPLVSAQQVFSILAGVTMLLIGLSVLGVLRFKWLGSGGSGLLAPMFAHFVNARGHTGFFLAGLATGFLPCGLVYSFLAMAVSTGNPVGGIMVMAAFGLGTVPAMVTIGFGSRLLSHAARRRVYQVAACFVVLLGMVTINRALPLGLQSAGESCHETVLSPPGQ